MIKGSKNKKETKRSKGNGGADLLKQVNIIEFM